jgi:hypothetical protein
MESMEVIAEQVRELLLSNINIASLSLGRKSEGNYALTVVNIDSPLTEEIKNSISSIDSTNDIYMVSI